MGRSARVLGLLRPYTLLFAANIVATLVASLMDGATFVLLIPFLRALFGQQALPAAGGSSVETLLAKRRGECNRCGACCKILFRCPFLGTDAEGQYTCRIYETRFAQCRLFPLHARDLLELGQECSYTFGEDSRSAPSEAASPEVPAQAGAK